MSAFFQAAFPIIDPGAKYMHNWHVDLVCEYLEACYEREITKLIINIPPRTVKSNAVTVAWPAWILGHDPSERIICASHSGSLSTSHSVDCRTIIKSEWYQALFPETRLADEQDAKTLYYTTQRGHRLSTSVGGSVVGEGGNILIGDDLIDPEKALSQTTRETTNNWLDRVWPMRKNDPNNAVEILVMQRVHVDDPAGHLMKNDSSWELLSIPQEAEGRTVITFPRSGRKVIREDGSLMHPERVGSDMVANYKTRLGSYGYSAQQQQRPSPKGGGMVKIKWFRRYNQMPAKEAISKIWVSIDTATKDKEINDPTGVAIWVETESGLSLIEYVSKKLLYPSMKRMVVGIAEKYREYDKPMELLVEDKGNGSALIADLRESTNYAIISMEPTGQGDKGVRISNESAVIESGKCLLPEQSPWLHDWEQEVMNFPNAPHDEAIDTMSQFLRRVREPTEIFIG